MNAQEIMRKVSVLLEKKEKVPVNVFPEKDNPYDSNAIDFKCFVDREWHRIGYIVRKPVNAVHSAPASRNIA